MLIFVLIFIFPCFSEAGEWKESLDFHLSHKHFPYIDQFHRGLSEAVQVHTEKNPGVSYVSKRNLPRGEKSLQPIDYDTIGNAFYANRDLHHTYGLRSPTNSENSAYASLQIIFDDFSSQFSHITDVVGGTEPVETRCFSSSGHNSHFAGKAMIRLEMKFDAFLSSKPSSFTPNELCLYHPTSHSEDKIYYALSEVYRKHIDAAWERKSDGITAIIGVVLHLHTRFDMCGSCAYALDWELNDARGFGQSIIEHCNRLNAGRIITHFSALVSSKQVFLVWGKERRTLPTPPPFLSDHAHYELYYDNYKRQIDFANDLAIPKKFAQAVVPAFLPPIRGTNIIYNFAKDSLYDKVFKIDSIAEESILRSISTPTYIQFGSFPPVALGGIT